MRYLNGVIGGIFLTLMILIDLIEQIRRFDEVDLSFGQLLHLTLLNKAGIEMDSFADSNGRADELFAPVPL